MDAGPVRVALVGAGRTGSVHLGALALGGDRAARPWVRLDQVLTS